MTPKASFRLSLAGGTLLILLPALASSHELLEMKRVSARVDEVPSPDSPSRLVQSQPFEYTVWEAPRYINDRRPFLVKFKEIAAEIEVFPFQWLAFPGACSAYLHDNRYVTHEHARRFFHFADLARQARNEDLIDCVAHLKEASPKEKALLLIVLHFSMDDTYLPVIARSVGDFSIPFPVVFNQEGGDWRREHRRRSWGEGLAVGKEVKQRNQDGLKLSFFEQRVLQDIHRYEPMFSPGEGPEQQYRVEDLKYVSDYALAILRLRGCELVESMHEMSQFREPSLLQSQMGGYGDSPTVETVFTAHAWDEFRSLPFHVRRLRCEYILQVECVAPPYQEMALMKFEKKLQRTLPRTAALTFFFISPNHGSGPKMEDLLIRDWAKYVQRIPKNQVQELLTSRNLAAIDTDLDVERRVGGYVHYHPYFKGFLVYVLRHRSQWFESAEFAEIAPQLNCSAQDAWETANGLESRNPLEN